MKPIEENDKRSKPVPLLNNPQNSQTRIQEIENGSRTDKFGDDNTLPLTLTAPEIEELLVRVKDTNELYLPLSSSIMPMRKKEMLYVPLGFDNGLTIDSLGVSGAQVSAIAECEIKSI